MALQESERAVVDRLAAEAEAAQAEYERAMREIAEMTRKVRL